MEPTADKNEIKARLEAAGFGGTWAWVISLFVIAGIVFGIGYYLRYKDTIIKEGYAVADGILVEQSSREEHIGRRRRHAIYIKIRFKPEGSEKNYEAGCSDSYLYVGGHHKFKAVYYKKDPNDAYVTRDDWLTGSFVPVSKNYDVPVVISFFALASGLYLTFDYLRAKKRAKKGTLRIKTAKKAK